MPPENLCSLNFMAQILSGKKFAFFQFEVCHFRLAFPRSITIKLLAQKIEGNEGVLRYLPDKPAKNVSKEYLVTVINTYQPSFLPNLIKEIEAQKAVKAKAKEPEVIELTPDMADLLEKMQGLTLGRINPRSLSNMRVGAKKSTRREFTARQELMTVFDNTEVRRNDCAYIHAASKLTRRHFL